MSGFVGTLAAVLALIGGSDAASAATLKASYSLQGSRASQTAGAPDLADIGPGNRFATETVDGAARQVLKFPKGGGVSLKTTGLVDPDSHSVVMTFRLADADGYRRLLDFKAGASDDGLYDASGKTSLYGGDYLGFSHDPAIGSSYVQVALTSEATAAGSQWTTVYVDGVPVSAATTAQGFDLRSGVLRFFKDNVGASGRGEESAGAVACILIYDGALTVHEVGQVAADPALCPAPHPAPPKPLAFKPGTYAGTTSQGLPIEFTVDATAIDGISFRWRAKCADGRVHTNGIGLGGGQLHGARFSVFGVLETGGRARVTGRLAGSRASGTLSRWAGSAFNTDCVARGVGWHAHRIQGQPPIY